MKVSKQNWVQILGELLMFLKNLTTYIAASTGVAAAPTGAAAVAISHPQLWRNKYLNATMISSIIDKHS